MRSKSLRILVTGADGFLGKNLTCRLLQEQHEVIKYTRHNTVEQLPAIISKCDFIIHLAGINRPKNISEFQEGNVELTRKICEVVKRQPRKIPIIFSSSIKADDPDSHYGKSKSEAENTLLELHKNSTNPVVIYRLPNVFGKWSKPNYNSVVATFCYNIARGYEIEITEPEKLLQLVYIDDVIDNFLGQINKNNHKEVFASVIPVYSVKLQKLANQINKFHDNRKINFISSLSGGLNKALYSTYISHLPKEKYKYRIQQHSDPRGCFAEVIKTNASGQFSFFTLKAGHTRGGHYHNSKTEKFLVLKGTGKFRFKNVCDGNNFELTVSSAEPEIVQTIPGLAHDITNIGDDELVCMLWANENFDHQRPDTIAFPLNET